MTTRISAAARVAALPLLLAACGRPADRAADSTVVRDTAAPSVAAAPATPATIDTAAGETTQGSALLDPNTATRQQLMAAGLADHVADAIIAGRPYENMLAVNKILVAHVPDSTARVRVYEHVWKPIDLNTATGDEILLIPGVGRRMRHEFEEYRPYTAIEQFRREIGKYVNKDEVARLERYVTIKK
jgi:DNA uptake protein ComE-like DNA-binding protein